MFRLQDKIEFKLLALTDVILLHLEIIKYE